MLKRILVIDDDEDNLFVTGEVLRDKSCLIKTLLDVDRLDEEIHSFKPELIVLDVCLGKIDGRIICDGLKASEVTKHIKVILISAKFSSLEFEHSDYNSCDCFIEKPFDIDDLSSKVKQLLNLY